MIIQKSDKGNTVVIVSKHDYIRKTSNKLVIEINFPKHI